MYINPGFLPLSSQSTKQSSQQTLPFFCFFVPLSLSFARSLSTPPANHDLPPRDPTPAPLLSRPRGVAPQHRVRARSPGHPPSPAIPLTAPPTSPRGRSAAPSPRPPAQFTGPPPVTRDLPPPRSHPRTAPHPSPSRRAAAPSPRPFTGLPPVTRDRSPHRSSPNPERSPRIPESASSCAVHRATPPAADQDFAARPPLPASLPAA